MATTQRHLEIAKQLPPKLLRFLARHPPAALRAGDATTTGTKSEGGPSLRIQPGYENPFSWTKNPITGHWRGPTYSLRRQADLAKLAVEHGVSDLLPVTTKSLVERAKKRQEQGLRVRGTGVGQKVKGHWWERALRHRLEARREAMRAMPQMVQDWKRAAHGRYWKQWPKKGSST